MNPQAFGKYQLLKKLATGGMAEVWLARQMGIEGFQKNLVVKRILPHLAEDREFVEMFRNEALIAARFNHPNIAQVYEFGEANGTYYIAMEFIHGEDLGRVMRKAASAGQWIARPLAIRIVAAACEGLHYAHTRTDDAGRPLRVVHRDISPQNILISFDGSVKLVDFGIAKAADQASLTKSGAIKGKFAYMAPEQASGKPLDARADIFAIGLVLYELLTGVRPLKRDSELATLQAAMECAIAAPSQVADVPEEMDPVVMRAVAKSADDRYRDARQFQVSLEEILVGQRWVAGSVQISELMETLFADRLSAEKAEGQVLPVGEDSAPSGTPQPPTPPRSGKASPAADMSWEAPPGEASHPVRPRASSPARPAAPPRRSAVAAPAVVEEDPGEWEAPSAEVELPGRRRTADATRRPSNPNATQVARTNSRSDLSRTVTGTGDVPTPTAVPAPAPRRSNTRAPAPMDELDTLPIAAPQRSRPALPAVEDRGQEEDDDERTRLPPPEPPPRRRPTGMQSSISPASEPPRRRTSSRVDTGRVDMPEPPPRVRPSQVVPARDDDELDRAIEASSRRTRRNMATRNVATIVAMVLMLGVVAVFHQPLLDILNKSGIDGQGVPVSINSNIKVRVSVKHTARCGSPQPVTELGETPLKQVSGAHIQDTLILENDQQGIYKEDIEALAYGVPGELKSVPDYVFRSGYLKLKLLPKDLKNIIIQRNGREVGRYPGAQIELMEGTHTLTLVGGRIRGDGHVIQDVEVKAGTLTEKTEDVSVSID